MTTVAIILSGAGVFDGSEVNEAVLTALAVDRAGARYVFFAPNIEQSEVINHLTQQPMKEKRNVLVEAARIARGKIQDIKTADVSQLDAAIFPGGFGAAKNLCDFATAGAACSIQADVLAFAQSMAKAGKPQGFICIAPAMISKIYGEGVKHTIGNDPGTAEAIEQMGGEHVACPVRETVVDTERKVVSTPAYMLAQHIGEAADGIADLVKQVLSLVRG